MFDFMLLGSEQHLFEQNPVKRLARKYLGHLGLGYAVKLWALKYILKNVDKEGNRKILDFGCSDGMYTFFFGKQFKQSDITGIDADEEGIKSAKKVKEEKNLKHLNFIYKNFDDYTPDTTYDLVFCLDCIHYTNNGIGYLEAVCQSVEDGGELIFSIPRVKRYYKEDFNFFTGRVNVDEMDELYSEKNMRELLEKNGFTIETVLSYPTIPLQTLIEDQRSQKVYIKLLYMIIMPVTKLLMKYKCDDGTHFMIHAKK